MPADIELYLFCHGHLLELGLETPVVVALGFVLGARRPSLELNELLTTVRRLQSLAPAF